MAAGSLKQGISSGNLGHRGFTWLGPPACLGSEEAGTHSSPFCPISRLFSGLFFSIFSTSHFSLTRALHLSLSLLLFFLLYKMQSPCVTSRVSRIGPYVSLPIHVPRNSPPTPARKEAARAYSGLLPFLLLGMVSYLSCTHISPNYPSGSLL